MRSSKALVAVTAILVASLATGCAGASGDPLTAPVTMNIGDLQGKTVDLEVGQVLNITTGDLAGDSYAGVVADEAIAEFIPARQDGDAEYNPGVKALAEGETQVTLTNSDGGIEDVTFTVEVD